MTAIISKSARMRAERDARVIEMYRFSLNNGGTKIAVVDAIAEHFNLSRATVLNIINREEEQNKIETR